MSQCRVCHSEYKPFINFGPQPIANGFIPEDKIGDEYFFEMQVGHCENCHMVQLIDQPSREQMFHGEYPFFSSLSKHMQIHFKEFAETIERRFLNHNPNPFVVEIGCNDGILLKNFAEKNIKHLGIEPSENVAKVAEEKGIRVTTRFFDYELADETRDKFGPADAILSANVICHIPYIESIFSGVEKLLAEKGVFAYEDPYLGDIIEKTSYDQIYDEHVFFFSALSVSYLANKFNLELIDVEPQATHGGSMRYYIARKGAYSPAQHVEQLIEKEKEMGLNKAETYLQFKKNVEKSKQDLVSLLEKIKKEGKRVVGYGATSKSTTVLNYCGIDRNLIEFISDTTPLKQGKLSPGKHIPIRSYDEFKENYPDYALLFAWNHRKEIMEKEEEFSKSYKWITYVPEVQIF